MRIGPYEFKPSLWPTLATLLMLPILLNLGFWQLDRAAQKRALLEDHRSRSGDAPINLRAPLRSTEGLRYRKVVVSGRYDGRHQFLLDNKVSRGRVGYQVLTPLRIQGSDYAVLVNRGWVPVGESRQKLPLLPTPPPERVVEVEGIVDIPPEHVFVLGEGEDRAYGWPKVLQRIRPELQEDQLGYHLMPVLVLLDPADADGFVREWRPVIFGPERHIGYAFQWFSLAAALVIIYVLVNLRKQNPEP